MSAQVPAGITKEEEVELQCIGGETIVKKGRGFRNWSPVAKCCSICCCFAVLLVAIMLPVANFVIVPQMAQSTMDGTIITLNNGTMILAPDFFANPNNITMVSDITMEVPGPMGASIHSFQATLSTAGYAMGYLQFPALDAKVGINRIKFTGTMKVLNSSAAIAFSTALMVNTSQPLQITGDPDVTAFMFTSTPHENKYLTCDLLDMTYPPAPMTVQMRCSQKAALRRLVQASSDFN